MRTEMLGQRYRIYLLKAISVGRIISLRLIFFVKNRLFSIKYVPLPSFQKSQTEMHKAFVRSRTSGSCKPFEEQLWESYKTD